MPLRRLVLLVSVALAVSLVGDLAPASAQEIAAAPASGQETEPTSGSAGGDGAATLLVVRGPGTSTADVVNELESADIEVGDAETMPKLATTQVEVDADEVGAAMDELRAGDGVSSVYLDQPATAFATVPNDPGFASQWGTRGTNVDDMWPVTTGAAGTVIAVIDSGVNPVPDLAGRLLPGKDFVNNDNNAADDHGHGTQVATVAAAAGNDGQGIAGACWTCRILPVKVLGHDGTGSLANVASAIVWSVDNGADVINLSLGGPTNIPAIDMAVSYATSHNVVVVAAAGNDGSTSPSYPAGVVGAIAVGASDPASQLYGFSNRGAGWVDVAAPGCNTASGSGSPSAFCGTSSAAPLTAGIVGLLRSAKPTLGASTIRAALETSAKPMASGGLVARGIVDGQGALNAITAAAGGTAPWVAKIDASKPTGAIADQGLYVSGITTTSIQTSDNVGVVSVRLFADGSMVGSATPGAGGRAAVTWFTGWKDGPVNLRATLVDAAGNSASTPVRMVRVDNRAPSLLLFEPGNEARVGKRFHVSVAAVDANDVLMTLVAVDGKIVGGSRGQGTFRFDATTPRSGRLQVVAASVDYAGHISFSNVITVNAKVKAARRRR